MPNESLDQYHLIDISVSLLFDVIADLPEWIAVTAVYAADKHEALRVGKELFRGHRVTVVLKEIEASE